MRVSGVGEGLEGGHVPVMSAGKNRPVKTMRMVLATQTLEGVMECQMGSRSFGLGRVVQAS